MFTKLINANVSMLNIILNKLYAENLINTISILYLKSKRQVFYKINQTLRSSVNLYEILKS